MKIFNNLFLQKKRVWTRIKYVKKRSNTFGLPCGSRGFTSRIFPNRLNAPQSNILWRGIRFCAIGIFCSSAGFILATLPLFKAANRFLDPSSDNEIISSAELQDEDTRKIEDYINNHSLSLKMRSKSEFTESRPHLRIPEPLRGNNLVSGTLMGPEMLDVPPVFWIDTTGKSLVSIVHLGRNLCGHPSIIHGGLLATLLDESLARCCFAALPNKVAMTARLNVKYRNPTPESSYVVFRANITRVEGRKAWVEGHIETLTDEGERPTVLAEASGLFIEPKKAAAMALNFLAQYVQDGYASNEAKKSACAPALSSSMALARFEFEAGKGNEGTKILMVEWQGEEGGSDWQVSWEGKTTVLPAKETAGDKLVRIYFLLAPYSSIPRIVSISRVGAKSHHMQTNPLPAIFPPELSSTAHIQKGVLHTIWAKKRLSALNEEISLEMKNGEGVGLEMALREKQWIEDNFGVFSKEIPELEYSMNSSYIESVQNERLSRKIKNLSLATNFSQINNLESNDSNFPIKERSSHPLSPDSGDVAVSSFSFFKSFEPLPKIFPNQKTRCISQGSNSITSPIQKTRIFNSTDTATDGRLSTKDVSEAEDGLFALKISPRSPEMTRSPFCGNL